MDCKVRADLPYPKFEVNMRDIYEVKLLMPVYGGRTSETTAVLNYVYYSYVLKESKPELSHCLESIAISEMRHHEMLGTAIAALGGTPYIGGNYYYWQGNFVNYAKDVVTVLKNAINGEKQAINDYKIVIAKTRMAAVKDMIERIILDEEIHVEILTELLNDCISGAGKPM